MTGIFRAGLMLALAFFATAGWSQGLEGTVDWNRRVSLGFGISGQVADAMVQAGDAVPSGQSMVALETTVLKIALDKATNIADIAQAQLEEQMSVLDRERTLYDEGALSGVQLQQVEIELSRREYALKDAELELQHARYRLELARLRAPFDAWVVDSGFTLGQFVNHEADDPPMITLAERGRYLARTFIDSETLQAYGAEVAVVVSVGDRRFKGLATRIGLEPLLESGQVPRYPIAVEFASDTLIRPGTACTISLE
ncbi:MAG: efflux RND transporter periplasmic adaptor subunit [Arenicellales bacterium]